MSTEVPARSRQVPDAQLHVALVEEWDGELSSTDPLDFPGYRPPPAGEESVRTGLALLEGTEVALVELRFDRHGGTMGAVTGERVVRAFRRATEARLPVVQLVATGGARLQEGMVSLVQMARTATAVADHAAAGLTTAALLQSPTTGGVFASWANLTDFRAAEPGATIGFGGPRVVEQVTGVRPPADSHTAESARAAGLVDAIVPRAEAGEWLSAAVGGAGGRPLELEDWRPAAPDATPVPADAWELLLRARAATRPSGLEWAAWLTESWVEIGGADPSIRAGLARIAGDPVVVVAMDRTAAARTGRLPGPEAFRVAQRAIRYADRVGLPVLTLVDTPGADPSPVSEAGGIAAEIARTLLAMAQLRTASVALVVGEGGSGGAMALAHTDTLLLLAGAPFEVIGAEAGAVVLHRDAARAAEYARASRIAPVDLLDLGVADAVVPERLADVRAAVVAGLGGARPGGRRTRPDQVTARALIH